MRILIRRVLHDPKEKMHAEKGICLTPHGHFETHAMSSFQTIGA